MHAIGAMSTVHTPAHAGTREERKRVKRFGGDGPVVAKLARRWGDVLEREAVLGVLRDRDAPGIQHARARQF